VRGDESETASSCERRDHPRWCGPHGALRIRAAPVPPRPGRTQAGQVERTGPGKTGVTNLSSDYSTPDLANWDSPPAGVTSATYGTLNFMTAHSEIPLATVTSNEANAYERWREGYQNNWQQFFDPIAVRFSISQPSAWHRTHRHPLIMASRYNSFIALCHRAQIAPRAGRPHTNVSPGWRLRSQQSQSVQEPGTLSATWPRAEGDFLSWLGQSVTL